MAPEQAAAKGHENGPLADVYALGAILYECLTGRPPFKAATAAETLLQVAWAEPVPPGRLQTGVPRDLETICLKCQEKEPPKRYASAAALADDLRRFLENRPIKARRTGPLERVWRWCRRNPTLAGVTDQVSLWPVPAPLEGDAERINLWLQVATGLELREQGQVLHVLDLPTWHERRRRLEGLGGSPLRPGKRTR